MNWRIFGLFIFMWLTWCWFVNSQNVTMQDAIVATVVGGIILALIGWVCTRAWSVYFKKHMFSICFIDHPPPGEREIDRWGQHPIPFGSSDHHYLKITCRYGIKLSKFNIRFIDLAEPSRGPGDTKIDIKPTIYVREVHVTRETIVESGSSVMRDDLYGGITVTLNRPFTLGSGEVFALQICVVAAHKPWIGKISFCGYDEQNDRRNARTDVEIIDVPTSEALLMPEVASTLTSTQSAKFKNNTLGGI